MGDGISQVGLMLLGVVTDPSETNNETMNQMSAL